VRQRRLYGSGHEFVLRISDDDGFETECLWTGAEGFVAKAELEHDFLRGEQPATTSVPKATLNRWRRFWTGDGIWLLLLIAANCLAEAVLGTYRPAKVICLFLFVILVPYLRKPFDG
jgi:hypothetical protein